MAMRKPHVTFWDIPSGFQVKFKVLNQTYHILCVSNDNDAALCVEARAKMAHGQPGKRGIGLDEQT